MSMLPMICVANLPKTAALLSDLFDWRATHGGDEFEEIVDTSGARVLWLHQMEAPEHPRFRDNTKGGLGRGLALYVFVSDIEAVHQRVIDAGLTIVEPLAVNPAARLRELTFVLADGYHFTVSDPPGWTPAG